MPNLLPLLILVACLVAIVGAVTLVLWAYANADKPKKPDLISESETWIGQGKGHINGIFQNLGVMQKIQKKLSALGFSETDFSSGVTKFTSVYEDVDRKEFLRLSQVVESWATGSPGYQEVDTTLFQLRTIAWYRLDQHLTHSRELLGQGVTTLTQALQVTSLQDKLLKALTPLTTELLVAETTYKHILSYTADLAVLRNNMQQIEATQVEAKEFLRQSQLTQALAAFQKAYDLTVETSRQRAALGTHQVIVKQMKQRNFNILDGIKALLFTISPNDMAEERTRLAEIELQMISSHKEQVITWSEYLNDLTLTRAELLAMEYRVMTHDINKPQAAAQYRLARLSLARTVETLSQHTKDGQLLAAELAPYSKEESVDHTPPEDVGKIITQANLYARAEAKSQEILAKAIAEHAFKE